jgi:hypothetical protein
MIENLMHVRLHLFVSRVDLFAQPPRVLDDPLGAAKIVRHLPADSIAALCQLGIDNLRQHQLLAHLLPGRDKAFRRRLANRLGRRSRTRLGLLRRRTLLPLGLRLGLSPHLGHPAKKIFDFVFHEKTPRTEEPRTKSSRYRHLVLRFFGSSVL